MQQQNIHAEINYDRYYNKLLDIPLIYIKTCFQRIKLSPNLFSTNKIITQKYMTFKINNCL